MFQNQNENLKFQKQRMFTLMKCEMGFKVGEHYRLSKNMKLVNR